MVTDYVCRASLYGGRFYTNSLGGSRIPITNGQAGILVNDAIGTYCPGSPDAFHWHAPYFPRVEVVPKEMSSINDHHPHGGSKGWRGSRR